MRLLHFCGGQTSLMVPITRFRCPVDRREIRGHNIYSGPLLDNVADLFYLEVVSECRVDTLQIKPGTFLDIVMVIH